MSFSGTWKEVSVVHTEHPSLGLEAKPRAEEQTVPPPTHGASAKGPDRQMGRWGGGRSSEEAVST